MGASLTERRRVDEEGRKVVKSFSLRRISLGVERLGDDVIRGISPGQLRASSRGNTYGASVVRNYWRKGRVGGFVSLVLKVSAQPTFGAGNSKA